MVGLPGWLDGSVKGARPGTVPPDKHQELSRAWWRRPAFAWALGSTGVLIAASVVGMVLAFAEIRPAATAVIASGLLDPAWLVEIEAEAVPPDG